MNLRTLERLLLIGGFFLFASLLYRLGPGTVLTNAHAVGWGIVLIFLQEILAYTANTAGWLAAFAQPRPAIPFTSLLAARIAGDAINYLTPTATLGGEFIRSRMLRRYAPTASIVASVAVAKLTQVVGLFAFVAIGSAMTMGGMPLPPGARSGLLVGLVVFAGVLTLLLLLQRRGMFAPFLRLAESWLGLGRAPHLRQALQHLDHEITRVHAAGTVPLVLSSASFFLGWALGTVESYLILWFLGLPATFERALAIEVFSVVVNNLVFFVPLRVGVQEAGKVAVFTLLGFTAASGLAAGILYRVRELAWALIGLLILYRQRFRLGSISEEVHPWGGHV